MMATVALAKELGLIQPKPLQDKVALVTGGARGIGRAIAIELASRGAAVAVNYRSSSAEAEKLLDEMGTYGRDPATVIAGGAKKRSSPYR